MSPVSTALTGILGRMWTDSEVKDGNRRMRFFTAEKGGHIMPETGVRGVDLFKIAGESISGWIWGSSRN